MRGFASEHRCETSLFWRYFFLLMMVLCLFLGALTVATRQSARSLQEAYLEQAEQAFYNDCSAFSEELLRTHELLAALEEFKYYAQANRAAAPLDRYEKYYLLQMGESVRRHCTMFGLPSERFLYFSRAGAADTPNRFFADAEDCFADHLVYRERPAFREELDLLLKEYAVNAMTILPAGSVSIGSREDTYLTILLLAVRQKQVFGFLYSVDEVLEQFNLNALPEGTSLRILDGNGEELFSAGGTTQETGRIEFSSSLDAVSCTAVIGIPQSYFDALTRDSQRVSQMIFFVSLLVGLLVCVLFSHISVKPFRRLIRDHAGDQGGEAPVNELAAIDSFLKRVQEKNAALRQMLLSSLLVRVYFGLSIPEGEKKSVSAAVPIFRQSLYAAIIRDCGEECGVEDSGSMAALFSQQLPEQFLCEYVNLREGILLFRAENGQVDLLQSILMQLNRQERERPRFVCGISAPFTGLDGIGDAMRQAQFCVPEEGERMLTFYAEGRDRGNGDEENFDVRQFQQALACWNRQELLTQIELCAAGAGAGEEGRAEEVFYTALHLLRSAARMGQLSFEEHEGLIYRSTSSPAVNLRRLRAVAADLFVQREGLLSVQTDQLSRQLLDYINASISDTELCLSSLMKQFGVSERFVHQAVRTHTGTNLTQYLIRIRMEEAAHLLRETDEPINAVALRCGCAAPSTFFRNFKKYHGVSPAEYRSAEQQA